MKGNRQQVAVRAAVPGDEVELAALDSLVNPSPWTAEQFVDACREQEDRYECALVMVCDEQPEGFVVYSRVLDEACIHNIAIRPAMQGAGLGQLLLTAALARLREAGAARCYLEVRESNMAAIGFYRRLGFESGGVRRNYYTTAAGREDAVLMSRQLIEQEC